MKKITVFILACAWSMTTFSQVATIKWYYTSGAHSYNKSGTLDMQYGRIDRGVVSPYKLALERDGLYLTGTEALAELHKPIWGDNADKTFDDILPIIDRIVPEFIQVSNWRTFPDAVPVIGDGEVFNLRVEIAPNKHKVFANASFDPYWWGVMAPVQWKPVDEPSYVSAPNPEYPAYQEKFTQYEQILSQTFTQMGTYIFPSLKLIEGVTWLIKYEGETEWTTIEVDPNHPLASATGGYIYKLLPVREYELRPWKNYVNSTILANGETRLKLLLGM